MARMVSEVAQGQQFQFSSGDNGPPTASQTRVFKVLLEQPGEIVNLQDICGVFIGDPHPYNAGIYCQSYGAQFDGDSRMVLVVTFTYESYASSSDGGGSGGGGGGSGGQPPDVRPANWSLSSSKMEAPVRTWRKRTDTYAWGDVVPATNPAEDLYDGVTKQASIIKISITQFDILDPTRHAEFSGTINKEQITLGSLVMPPHTVMFDGVSVQSVVKPWGAGVFRGWESTYEFSFWRNETEINVPSLFGDLVSVPLGWDIAVPQSGWNVIAFNPVVNADSEDEYGQPLKHNYPNEDNGVAIDDTKALELPDGVSVGDKVRAMVKVFSYKGGGKVSQSPSASPVALNDNGSPRKSDERPLVYGYQVCKDINFTQTLGLRLY